MEWWYDDQDDELEWTAAMCITSAIFKLQIQHWGKGETYFGYRLITYIAADHFNIL